MMNETIMEDSLLSAVLRKLPLIRSAPNKSELLLGPSVKSINATNHTATLDNGDEISFKRCLIAVGTTTRNSPIGNVVARNAARFVSGAQSKVDWRRIDNVFQQNAQLQIAGEVSRAHMTVVGGG